jgi:hypothetical protein
MIIRALISAAHLELRPARCLAVVLWKLIQMRTVDGGRGGVTPRLEHVAWMQVVMDMGSGNIQMRQHAWLVQVAACGCESVRTCEPLKPVRSILIDFSRAPVHSGPPSRCCSLGLGSGSRRAAAKTTETAAVAAETGEMTSNRCALSLSPPGSATNSSSRCHHYCPQRNAILHLLYTMYVQYSTYF